MLSLPNVTLCALGSEKYREGNQEAIDRCTAVASFGAVKNITRDCKSLDEYSRVILFDLAEEIETDFALIIQRDSWIINPDLWTDEFFKYDYIGAPWPRKLHFTNEGKEVRVGNGGFTLRSKRMLSAFNDLHLAFTDNGTGFWNEDGNICVYHRKLLEEHEFKFAPVKLAARFSTELVVPETCRSFGFHRYLVHVPIKL